MGSQPSLGGKGVVGHPNQTYRGGCDDATTPDEQDLVIATTSISNMVATTKSTLDERDLGVATTPIFNIVVTTIRSNGYDQLRVIVGGGTDQEKVCAKFFN
jgi:hypothetical protein